MNAKELVYPPGTEWLKKPFHTMTKDEYLAISLSRTIARLRREEPAHLRPVYNFIRYSGSPVTELFTLYGVPAVEGDVERLFTSNGWPSAEDDPYAGDWSSTVAGLGPYLCRWELNEDDTPTVSFYASVHDMLRHKRTTMKAGRFIKKACSLPDAAVEDFVAGLKAALGVGKLSLAVTAEEIASVYRNGNFQSCMKGSGLDRQYEGKKYHPAEIYCYPHDRLTLDDPLSNGVAVAYLGPLERPVARSVVRHWPDGEKTYVRVYGDDNLMAVLEREGYRADYDTLRGARLTLVGSEDDGYLMPYIDYWDGIDVQHDGHGREYGVVNRHCPDIERTQTGWATGRDSIVCQHCDETFDEEDVVYLERYDSHVCQGCLAHYYTYCIVDELSYGYEREYIVDDEACYVDGVGDCSEEYARKIAHECEHCGNYFMIDDMVSVSQSEEDSPLCCEGCVEPYRRRHGYIKVLLPTRWGLEEDWSQDYTVDVEGLEYPVVTNEWFDVHIALCECGVCHATKEHNHSCEHTFPTDRTPGEGQLALLEEAA